MGVMSIAIDPELEARLRAQAEAEGLTIEAYLEHLVRRDQRGREELAALALEALNSGEAIEIGPGYWEEKHRRLDARLTESGAS